MTADTPDTPAVEQAEDATPETPTPDAPEGDNLGDDKLAEMARPYLAPAEQDDALELHHDDEPLDMPDLRIGRSIFAELAREAGDSVYVWPDLPPPPVIVSGPDGIGAKFDAARAANEEGFIADKVEVAGWARAARVRTHGSAAAA